MDTSEAECSPQRFVWHSMSFGFGETNSTFMSLIVLMFVFLSLTIVKAKNHWI